MSNPKERLQMLNYGGCTLKILGVGIVYVEYLFLNSSYSKKKKIPYSNRNIIDG